jgi:hypothetical protein
MKHEAADGRPGRTCPLHYRYAPGTLAREPDLRCATLYVIGGLYGNSRALESVMALAASEPDPVSMVFNGDFNWFDCDADEFSALNQTVLRHTALRGNVETEIAAEEDTAGCGCGYPDWVGQEEVDRSNRIMTALRATARRCPELRARLAALPMHLTAEVGGIRVAIVHGDTRSLAGWNFAQESLLDPAAQQALAAQFDATQTRVIASSHTCLPVAVDCDARGGYCVLINNGAAGMPNFRNMRFGLITRVSTQPAQPERALYGTRIGPVHIDALPVHYDHEAWLEDFLRQWPAGSPAHDSYYRRICTGPEYTIEQAVRLTVSPPAIRRLTRTLSTGS